MTKKMFVLMMTLCAGSIAQSIDLTGTVTNASNSQPIQGVVVTLKNTPALIDTTKADGMYQLSGATGVIHNLSGTESFSGSRFASGLLEISVTKQEPVTVETFSLSGVLRARLVHDMMEPGLHKVNIRSSCANEDLCLIKVRQGDKTTVYPYLPMRSSLTNSTMTNTPSAGLSKSEAFNDTLIFTMGGFTMKKIGVNASTGVNNIALQPSSTVMDIDGNAYTTVTIGTQVWMAENLKTTKLNDGTAIPMVTDLMSWVRLSTPGYCWYNNDTTNKNVYGALYNYNAVHTGKLAPTGWHVPTNDEWNALQTFAGGYLAAGGALKETGTALWTSPNVGATDTFGFSALPAGARNDDGPFFGIGTNAYWWTADGSDWVIINNYPELGTEAKPGVDGFSVRCIKDK